MNEKPHTTFLARRHELSMEAICDYDVHRSVAGDASNVPQIRDTACARSMVSGALYDILADVENENVLLEVGIHLLRWGRFIVDKSGMPSTLGEEAVCKDEEHTEVNDPKRVPAH